MKKTLIINLLLILLAGSSALNAQSGLYFDASQLYTTFKFSDSQGNALNSDYHGMFKGAYGFGYRFVLDNGFTIKTGIGMNKAGATMVYDDMNYKWDLQYAVFKLGLGYMLKRDRVSPYVIISGYYGYMLSGYQTLNNEDFDIKDSQSLQVSDYGLYFTPGVEINFTEAISSYIEFNYMMGLQNLEKVETQKSSNNAYGLTLGLTFSFIK